MAGATEHLLIFCSLLLTAASPTAVRPSGAGVGNLSCAGNFKLRDLSCYSYPGSEVRRTFQGGQRYCWRLGASLASLLSPGEEVFVLELVQNDTSFWIGLSDEGERRFIWIDGSSVLTHAHWKEGEPSTASHLHCAVADSDGWALAGGGCASSKLPFVCKKRACPEGFDWNGSDCRSTSPSLSLLSCHTLTLLAALSLVCVLVTLSVCNRSHTHTHSISSESDHHFWLT